MKKTLLIAAAALAASVITSQAQVYSQNIVGYVNVPLPGGYNLISAPLSVTSTNSADDLLDSGLQGGDTLFVWNGGGYNIYNYGGSPGVWFDQNFSPVNAPLLPPGTGYYYQNNSGSPETNTFVGTVQLTNTVTLPGGYNYIALTPPIGTAADSTNALGNVLQGGDTLFLWNGGGYNIFNYGGSPGVWFDQNFSSVSAPTLPVGYGFIYQNNSGAPEIWTNNFTVQ